MRSFMAFPAALALLAMAPADEGKPGGTSSRTATTDTPKTGGETDAERDARLKAEADAVAAAERNAAEATEDARRQSLDTLKQQESMEPYPSQEEADRMKARNATDAAGAGYVTRDQTKG